MIQIIKVKSGNDIYYAAHDKVNDSFLFPLTPKLDGVKRLLADHQKRMEVRGMDALEINMDDPTIEMSLVEAKEMNESSDFPVDNLTEHVREKSPEMKVK
ncbi:hypothetical protein COT97_04755 [Candidatus Falkowbacteria bacterium CG10_big_fil_rev_8_21_14_0_10_39_11]|uniref:Uncharacterized protein n=1 Tax=Candidatus Falkowbacteria bacterium CG10_big_fil_rev_8_21_14_0_10_39_11 TaxID=1974565 RepID=A0A2H0V413_9BACT|nr:MAG: hypothetical protein COT97_04755 [Candidatus Falkowbacteria bacterium CG10_big_fil_rev_8_21_14_0_10_39_11]